MEHPLSDIIVIGGGVVGLAAAYKLCLKYPEKRILVLEKEKEVAMHQTGRNSGVIHSGLYYKPGSYKAKNCVDGRRELITFCQKYKVTHDICGKIVVATDPSELEHMDRVYNNGLANGVEGLEKIDAKKIKEIEPFAEGVAGLLIPCTGIIDFKGLCLKLEELINASTNSKVLKEQEVTGFDKQGSYVDIITKTDRFKASNVIVCAGLQSDRLAKREGTDPDSAIVGFRGDYYDLTDKGRHKVKNLIYPVPNPKYPFLGVHFTRMTTGNIECGPNAVFVFKREGYRKTDFSCKDTTEALTFKGTWKFFFNNMKFAYDEYLGAFSKAFFLKRLRKLIPSLESDDIIVSHRAGVRAMALSKDGKMIDDFKIVKSHRIIHVLNAPSPAATAALSIGTAIEKMATEHFSL